MALSLKAPEADALARQVARLTGEGRQPGLDILRDFLPGAQIETVPLSPDNVEFAIDAFHHYRKGRHRAGFNLGDCFYYAPAQATGETLLFKGDDFVHADVRPAC